MGKDTGNFLKVLVDGFSTFRNLLGSWFTSVSVFAGGFMLAYLLFLNLFGPIYSIKSLVSLAINDVNNPYTPVTFILRFYLIAFFSAPLGLIFQAARKGQRFTRRTKHITAILIITICLADILRFHKDSSLVFTVISFTALLLLMAMDADEKPYPRRSNASNLIQAFGALYAASVALLLLLNPASIDFKDFAEIQAFLIKLLYIHLASLPLALAATSITTATSHSQKPKDLWLALISAALFSAFTLSTGLYLESLIFATLTLTLLHIYRREPNLHTAGDSDERTASLGKDPSLNPLERIVPLETANLIDSANKLLREYTAYLKTRTKNTSPIDDLTQCQSALTSISKSLEKVAEEATAFREITTGEILRVKTLSEYAPPIYRTTEFQGVEKNTGVTHYLICSRTGHGKTTLMKNLMNSRKGFAFFVIDRHSEYETFNGRSEVIVLDEVIDVSETERILSQIPRTKLASDQSVIRDSLIFSLEQQFNYTIERLLPPMFVKEIQDKLFNGKTVILQPGTTSEIVYTRIVHEIIYKIFERKIVGKIVTPLAIVNEEAHNSYEIAENGMERNRAHILVRLVLEGRKYSTSLINLSSDPENIPKNIRDNSTLIVGSIGTPALKSLVGDKLGKIYISYIHSLPVGHFFIDEVDRDGDYIVFPNHFGCIEGKNTILSSEGMSAVATEL